MRSLNIKYIPELDQLRGLAALLVLYFHAVAGYFMGLKENTPPIIHNPLELIVVNGFTGVALFFVISGFLFTWGALQHDGFDWKNFFINRVLRIYPLYLLILIVAFSLVRGSFSLDQVIFYAFGLGNMQKNLGDFDIVLWTISVEFQFYALFPFLILLLKHKGIRFIWGIIAALTLLRAIIWFDHAGLHDPTYWTLLGRLDQFLIGMTVAWLAHRQGWLQGDFIQKVHPAKLVAGLAVASGFMMAVFWYYTRIGWRFNEAAFSIVWPTVEALLWAFLGIFYVALARRLRWKVLLAIQFAGMISYSLYLLHMPIIKALHTSNLVFSLPGDSFISGLVSTTVLVLPIGILASLLTYYFIEKPPLDMRKQYATFKRNHEQPPTATGSDA